MRLILVVALATLLAACSTVPAAPVVDPGVSVGNYPDDLAACRTVAEQTPSPGRRAAMGAMVGSVLGALIGAAVGLDRDSVTRIAATGLVSGAATGAVDAATTQQAIVARCMAGRGWNVLT